MIVGLLKSWPPLILLKYLILLVPPCFLELTLAYFLEFSSLPVLLHFRLFICIALFWLLKVFSICLIIKLLQNFVLGSFPLSRNALLLDVLILSNSFNPIPPWQPRPPASEIQSSILLAEWTYQIWMLWGTLKLKSHKLDSFSSHPCLPYPCLNLLQPLVSISDNEAIIYPK